MTNRILCLLIVILIFSKVPAHAYLDPGTGSIIFQALLVAAFTLKIYWRRLTAFFSGKKASAPSNED